MKVVPQARVRNAPSGAPTFNPPGGGSPQHDPVAVGGGVFDGVGVVEGVGVWVIVGVLVNVAVCVAVEVAVAVAV